MLEVIRTVRWRFPWLAKGIENNSGHTRDIDQLEGTNEFPQAYNKINSKERVGSQAKARPWIEWTMEHMFWPFCSPAGLLDRPGRYARMVV